MSFKRGDRVVVAFDKYFGLVGTVTDVDVAEYGCIVDVDWGRPRRKGLDTRWAAEGLEFYIDPRLRITKTNLGLATLRSANKVRQQEWDTDNKITLAYRGNELAGETGEACNIVKKIERERLGITGSRATKEQLAEELADVIICADLIAMDCEIDLSAAVVDKFNKSSEKVGLKTRITDAP